MREKIVILLHKKLSQHQCMMYGESDASLHFGRRRNDKSIFSLLEIIKINHGNAISTSSHDPIGLRKNAIKSLIGECEKSKNINQMKQKEERPNNENPL